MDRNGEGGIGWVTMPTIEVSPETYERLAQRATASHTSVGDVVAFALEALPAEHEPAHQPSRELSNAEFSELLRSMAIDMPGVPPLPENFSREDIYFDHD